MIAFTLPGEPKGKGRARVSVRGGFARAYTPAATVSYERQIALAAWDAGATPIRGPVALDVYAYHAIPRSWPRAKRASAIDGFIRPTGPRNDLDNVVKAVSDALNGVAYLDDGQVVELRAERAYSVEPRVSVEVRAIHTAEEMAL